MKVVDNYNASREEFLKTAFEDLPSFPYCAEIGVYQGDFSAKIIEHLSPMYLYLIDPFVVGDRKYNRKRVEARFRPYINQGSVVVKKNYSHEIVETFTSSFFDFIYHDASHFYVDVKRDLNQWLPKLKKKGLMCGHDYIEHDGFGVIQAVDEFCEEHNFEMIIFNENGGDYALKRK